VSDYAAFQRAMASRGFLASVLTEREFNRLSRIGLDQCQIEGVAMDVNGGFGIAESLRAMRDS